MFRSATPLHRAIAFVFLALLTGGLIEARADENRTETAIFAGGCFWCVESDFDVVPGVLETISGYAGGASQEPTYEEVTRGGTGHLESVRITFDPELVTYEELLRVFWRSVDPTDAGGQFCDRGESYKTAVFATDEAQYEVATASKQELADAMLLEDPIVTEVRLVDAFWEAEGYHQNYYQEHPYRYRLYRFGCGRDARVKSLWGEEAWGGYGHGDS